jgi:flagellar hook-associated protein 1
MSLSRIFDISRRSLATYQKALDSTAHNVSNASNPDFSRRRVVLTADVPEMNAGLVFGTGVRLVDIQRLRDTFADNQIRSNNQKNSDSSRQSALLSQVEQIFNEPTEQGLGGYISSFFNSWSQLAVNPSSVPLRSNLINSANLMSSKIKSIHDDLDQIRETTVNDFSTLTSTLNTNLKDIELLNKQIYESKVMGSSSADLEDKRDTLIDEISKIVNTTVTYDEGGSAIISVGGILAADRFYHTQFSASWDD